MPAKPSVNKCDDHNSMVNRHIGTAYDNVRIVAEHIAEVINVSEGIEPISLYLGAFSTPPTEGWNGESLQSGNFYLNTTENTLDYYDADDMVWISVDEETVVQAAQTAVAARDAALLAQAAAELAETNAESSAAAALQSEQNAALAEANSQASANASASSASDSATSAAEALASENAAKASETAAAQSESNATTSETNAANSASAAATSESNAGSSEAAAANSAVVAAGYAADAEAAFDNFNDQYLGAKATDPTVDNDGNPLQVGATYWNATTNDLRFWNGATWDVPEQTAIQAANDAVAARDDAQVSETNAAASEAAASQSETNAAQSAASALDSKNDIDVLLENAGYHGLWPDSGGSALKGETYQTQVGGVPTGDYYTALKNTSVDPVGDNVNWKVDVSGSYVNQAQEELISGKIFPESGTVKNGDTVPVGTTHLRVLIGGESAIIAMSPVASGVVSSLTEISATIGVTSVTFSSPTKTQYKTVSDMLSSDSLYEEMKVSTGVTDWKITSSPKGLPTSGGLHAIPLNGLWFQDYDVDNLGVTPCSAKLNSIVSDLDTYGVNTSIRLGNGDFLFDSTVEYLTGTKIRGEGRRGDYKYVTEDDAGGTLIIVDDGVTAFQTNSQWALYPEISGVTFRAKTHGSSTYGSAANYSVGTNGIDVLYSIDGEFNNLAFESMDQSIFNRLGNGQESLRPRIKDVVAQDCNYVMRFIDGAADVHVSDIPICLHCNYMINCDTVDGFHFSDIRFFQSYNVSVSFVNSQFVNGSNIVLFETASTQMIIDNCDNVDISALTLSRAGWYHMGTPFPPRLALNVINSRNVKLNGIIERPSGKAINIVSSDQVNINMDVKAPFNTNGGASATTVFTSKNVEISGVYKIRGNAANSVEADNSSRYEVTSKVTGDAFDKNLRFIDTNAFEFKGTIESGTAVVNSGTSAALITEKIKVPAGKKLILGHIRYDNTNGLRPRIGSNFFLSIPTTDEGVEDSSQYVLLDNSSGGSVQDYALTVQLYNNTGGAVNTGLDTITCYLKLLD